MESMNDKIVNVIEDDFQYCGYIHGCQPAFFSACLSLLFYLTQNYRFVFKSSKQFLIIFPLEMDV